MCFFVQYIFRVNQRYFLTLLNTNKTIIKGHHIFLLSRKAGEDSVTDRGGSSIQPDLRVKVKGKPEADAIKTHLNI
jgi:hypothetical protein